VSVLPAAVPPMKTNTMSTMISPNVNASFIYHALKLSDALKKNTESVIKKHGITAQQLQILLLLANDPNTIFLQEHPQQKPLMAKEVAQALDVSRANITNLLNILIGKKLVASTEDDNDKRRKRLKLTPSGNRLVQKAVELLDKKNETILSGLSQKQKESFILTVRNCLALLS
jgi:DNA-binding MarR family transcriptional regulator